MDSLIDQTSASVVADKPCYLLAMPDELVEMALEHFPLQDLKSFSETSRDSHRLSYAKIYRRYKTEHDGNSWLDRAASEGRTDIFTRAIHERVAECRLSHLLDACRHNRHADLVRLLLTQQDVLDGYYEQTLIDRTLRAGLDDSPFPRTDSPFHAAVSNITCQAYIEDAEPATHAVFETMVDLLLATEPGRRDPALLSVDEAQGVLPVICLAARVGCKAVVQKLLQYGADVNAIGCSSDSPLSLALTGSTGRWSDSSISLVRFLLESGADPNAVNWFDQRPLHYAVTGPKIITEMLLEHGASVNETDKEGRTPLFIAAIWGKDEVVHLLLDSGASGSVLLQAVEYPHCSVETLRRLVDRETGADEKDSKVSEALYKAVKTGASSSHIDFLLRAGADPTAALGPVGCSLLAIHGLFVDCWSDRLHPNALEIVKVFHSHGADINPQLVGEAWDLMGLALRAQSTDVVDYILQHSSHTLVFTDTGDVVTTHSLVSLPVYKARTHEFIDWLIDHGMNVCARSATGGTLLHRMVISGYGDEWILKHLLERGLDIDAADIHGNTALHLSGYLNMMANVTAASQPRIRWTTLLLDYGACPDLENHAGDTVEDIARKFRNYLVLMDVKDQRARRMREARRALLLERLEALEEQAGRSYRPIR